MCDCIKKINENLSEKGLELETSFRLNFETGNTVSLTPLRTAKIDAKARIKTTPVLPSYCPFCGEKIDEP